MKKLLAVLILHCMPLVAIGGEVILDEEIARSVIAELSEASQRLDIEHMRKYVDSESTFIWKTSIEGGKDGKEANGDQWLALMEFLAPMSEGSAGEFHSQIRSVHIDSGLNQATVVEDVTQTYPVMGVMYKEQATETCVLGVRNGSIKVISWERNTTEFAEITSPESASPSHKEMQLVPGATYRRGSDLGELEGIRTETGLRTIEPLMPEVPSHEATVSDFFMDTFDVTNQQFAEFVKAVPRWSKDLADTSLHNGRYLEHWVDGSPSENLLDHPVTFVTWQAAVAYCEWRDKRLPTEAEYEWAAQDGVSRAEYPWGDSPPHNGIVNWSGNGVDATVPVGSYRPNARGLYDMSGNVWHFTSDPWLGSYAEMLDASAESEEASSDPRIRRVVRGGSWGANAANLRVRYRDSHRPFDAREMVGFRCARSSSAAE